MEWFIPDGVMPLAGVMVDDDGEEEYFIPALGMLNATGFVLYPRYAMSAGMQVLES